MRRPAAAAGRAGGAALLLVLALPGCAAPPSPAAKSWWAHVEHLAADSLEGRDTGSPGHRRAAEYVARQFRLHGAEPGGSRGYFQPVAFVSRRIREEECRLWLVRGGAAEPVRLGEEANIGMSYEPADSLEAPAVFVGYGLSIPEIGYDDLAGLDLRGKIAVYLQGGPESIPGPLRAHAQSTAERWKQFRAAGVVGMASIPNPSSMDVPWERATLARLQPSMTLADGTLDQTPGLKLSLRFNPAHAQRLFAGTGHEFSAILALADSGVALPTFPLPAAIRARVRHARTAVESDNVVGVVRGRDPDLADECVVLSAHLDHLGIGGAIDGDSIYNGAMDNASGVATLIEIARLANESELELRRSLVLLAVTGEEKGLQGSRYFAAYPTVPAAGIVANVNMDMYLPIVPLRIVTVYGLQESDLGERFRAVAEEFGLEVEDDPEPRRNIFIRSDQYSFIRRGVPAIFFKFGAKKGSREERVFREWIAKRYHAPSDDLRQPVDKDGAARFTRLLLEFATRIANEPARPRWKDESFFRRYAAGAGEAGGTE